MKGTLADGVEAKFSFSGDGLSARYSGKASLKNGGISTDGKASIRTDDLEPWLMAGGVALPGMGLGMPVDLSADANYGEGVLILSGLEGSVAGVSVAGDINAETGKELPRLTGSIRVGALDLGLPAEAVLGAGTFEADGKQGWPTAAFQPAATPPFAADVEIIADQVAAGTLGNGTGAHMNLRIGKDGMRLSNFEADFGGGRLSGLFDLRNDGGTGLLSTQFQLRDARLGDLLPGNGITGRGDISVSLSMSGKTVESMVGSASGSGTMAARDLVIDGLNPAVFPQLLAQADKVGHDIDAKATAGFAPELVRGGRFAAARADVALTIAGGVVRAPPVRIDSDHAVLTADLRADLAAGTASAQGTLEFKAGTDALVGSEPAVGFTSSGPLDQMNTTLDTAPLAQYLTQRALEKEQARVEAMQAGLLETQRLRREVRYYAALENGRSDGADELRRFMMEQRRTDEQDKERAAGHEPGQPAAAGQPQPDTGNGAGPSDQVQPVPLPLTSPTGGGDTVPAQLPETPQADNGLPGATSIFRKENLSLDTLMKTLAPGQ